MTAKIIPFKAKNVIYLEHKDMLPSKLVMTQDQFHEAMELITDKSMSILEFMQIMQALQRVKKNQ